MLLVKSPIHPKRNKSRFNSWFDQYQKHLTNAKQSFASLEYLVMACYNSFFPPFFFLFYGYKACYILNEQFLVLAAALLKRI